MQVSEAGQTSFDMHSAPSSGLIEMQYFCAGVAWAQNCLRPDSLIAVHSSSRWQGTAHMLKPAPVSMQSPTMQSNALEQRVPGSAGRQTLGESGPDRRRQQV